MAGSRSVCILLRLTKPSTRMSTTPTSTVKGFLTLNFDSMVPLHFPTDWSVGFSSVSIAQPPLLCKAGAAVLFL